MVLYYWNFSETVCMPFWAILTLIIVISKKNHEMFCHVSRLTKWFPCSQQKDHHAAKKILTFSTFWRWDLHLFMIVRAWRTISNTSASDTDSDGPFEGPREGDDDELDLWIIGFSPFLVRFFGVIRFGFRFGQLMNPI